MRSIVALVLWLRLDDDDVKVLTTVRVSNVKGQILYQIYSNDKMFYLTEFEVL